MIGSDWKSDKHPVDLVLAKQVRIDMLEREVAQAKELLANQKELILHLYGELDKVKK